MEYSYIDKIDSPADLKRLGVDELPKVCAELRQYIIESLSKNPGHLASSLGAIELTVALHYVFDCPNDKLVWDVGHQAYAHKILTGRRDRFATNRQLGGLSGFVLPAESEYDAFVSGHASNSISAALGIDVASRLEGKERNVVAIIGDGAMTGGLAFEGLNNVSMDKNNLLIVLNDNNMAIDPLHGGFTEYLLDLTTRARYNKWRWRVYCVLAKLGLMNDEKKARILRGGNSLKAMLSGQPSNIFQGLNIRYFGPTAGHDVISLVRILSEIKHHRGPKVLHIVTKKGKGYAPAEANQTVWHAPGEFNVATGERKKGGSSVKLWQEVFGDELLALAEQDKRVVGVTPAMPSGCGMTVVQKAFPERVFDVGIAEGHAVTFSAGMAKAGLIPYCNIYSSFMQRAYDNIVHDVCLDRLPVVLCVDRAGIVGNDGATHHGLLDMCYLRCVPNLSIGAPRVDEDLRAMMRIGLTLGSPLAIRYPRGRSVLAEEDYQQVEYGKGVCLREGKEIAVLSIGAIGNAVSEAIEGTDVGHYDMRWLKPLDEALLEHVAERYQTIITVEDGMIAGGFGSAVAEWLSDRGYMRRVVRLGVKDKFVEQGSTAELYHLLGLDTEGIRNTLCDVQLRMKNGKTCDNA